MVARGGLRNSNSTDQALRPADGAGGLQHLLSVGQPDTGNPTPAPVQPVASNCAQASEHSAAPVVGSPALHGVNVLLMRVVFELLNSTACEGRLGGVLQKWLDEIRRPAYLERSVLTQLSVGCTSNSILVPHNP